MQIIAEVKTHSPFGWESRHSWDELFTIANDVGDIISIHTNPRWHGSFDLIKKARKLTDKPILAKGIHASDNDIQHALDAGATYVLVVGRIPKIHLGSCFIEPNTLQELARLPKGTKAVWNSRDLQTGGVKPDDFAIARAAFTGWLCQASNIATKADINTGADAVLVGTYLPELSDGISDEEEALAPNAGDANNDGTQDSEQSNVASYYNFITESYSVLETDCNSISAIQLGRESSEMPDAAFEYPMGLLSFHIECEDIGDTATITQYYYGTTDNDSYSARKWLDDGSYQEIPGYTVESVTIDGEPVLKVSYQITDGGPLDDDGEANAVIVDPSGAAVLAAATNNGNNSDPLSNTGQTIVLIYGIALTLIAGLIGFKLATRQQKPAKK